MTERTEQKTEQQQEFLPPRDPDAQPIKALRDPLDPNTCNENKKGMYTSRFVVREHVKFREAAMRKDFTEITDLLAKALKNMDEKYKAQIDELEEQLGIQHQNHMQLLRAYNFTHRITRRKLTRMEGRWWERLAMDIDADVMFLRNWWNTRVRKIPSSEVLFGEQLDAFENVTDHESSDLQPSSAPLTDEQTNG